MTHSATDFSKPNGARVYDYLLGGIESFKADRDQAAGLLRICPSLGIIALENRYFLARAVTWAAGQGLDQFVDLGAGAPIRKARAGVLEDVHLTAQAANPSARVAYVDDDAVVIAHSRAFRAPARGVAVTAADLTYPDAVLADRGLRAVIDLAQPTCIIFGLVLGLLPPGLARQVVAGYAARLAPGSLIVVSCGRCDDDALWKQLSDAYTPAPVWNHSSGDITRFLDGLELVPPGLVPAQAWRGGWHDAPTAPPILMYVLAAAARKR